MEFGVRLHNRLQFPNKHIVICEDDIDNQIKFAHAMRSFFPPQGDVQIDIVSSAVAAACICMNMKVDLIILDHDMPYGFGSELITFLHAQGKIVPIITASDIPENNANMVKLATELGYPVHHFQKQDTFALSIRDVVAAILYPPENYDPVVKEETPVEEKPKKTAKPRKVKKAKVDA